ncbi:MULTISPECIES: rRNA maturation RNase YbeY [Aequorivita]|uniref:Endoribonuclease YbeY n=1 Tax=Aequorivita iocasae TaxID=2803865 RepID=A0ABX7DWR6_9FLAO|nr:MULTISPECIES: rRNA maturation RNase YbeY [Aequorivita]QQX77619.1 rRNA maturation RNase YbeY [Aequorivita iocasae]UCA57116.1 rRNA maturation RNase YbeY [Aequorivita sp. F7]
MIEFNYLTDFRLENESNTQDWILNVITSEDFEVGEIVYIFCDDDYLYNLNKVYLNHDTLTDIISFDYGLGKQVNGEIYISIERVADNAKDFNTDFKTELNRVIIHGILHFCGYKDKSKDEKLLMRKKEDEALLALSKQSIL